MRPFCVSHLLRLTRVCTLGLLMCVGLSRPVAADPLIITGGELFAWWDGDKASFEVFGADFRISGETSGTSPDRFVAGETADMSATISMHPGDSDLPIAQATIGDTDYGQIWLGGQFEISGTPFVVPAAADGTIFTTPFTATGHITGYAVFPGPTTTPLFEVMLVGHGTAERQVGTFVNGQYISNFGGTRYRFEETAPAPVPEPATLLLLGAGLAGTISRTVRRRPEHVHSEE